MPPATCILPAAACPCAVNSSTKHKKHAMVQRLQHHSQAVLNALLSAASVCQALSHTLPFLSLRDGWSAIAQIRGR